MKFVLPMAAVVFLLAAITIGYLFQRAENTVPVLNYHQVNNSRIISPLTVTNRDFAKQMQYLADNGYHTVTVDELILAWEQGAELPDKPVVITFDDGYVDNYEWAYPILKHYNFKATIFLVSDFMDRFDNYLTWDNVKTMHESGLIDFESHTLSHEELTKLKPEEIRHQLTGSRKALEWRLKKPVHCLAYPCGSYNEEVLRLMNETGYKAAFTVNYGLAGSNEPRLALNRIPVFGGMAHGMLRFKLRLAFAPVIAPLSDLKADLQKGGMPWLAELIYLP